MIARWEILDLAGTLGLLPQVVEKDYVLGWVLAGIYRQTALSGSWIFKGGTCLKKCYFETYRFSEDLDFTLTDPSQIDRELLAGIFRDIGGWIYDETGIELPEDQQEFDIFENPRGTVSCQGKLSYRGPIAPRSGGLPRIKLDLTPDELCVLPPAERVIFHDYSDEPEGGITVLCYTYEEAFAEKVRALGDRARPRDLYDVVNLYHNAEARPRPAVLLDVLEQKCGHRGLAVPALENLETRKGDLEGSWQSMLSHQLPALPPVESFWEALPEFFAWLRSGVTPAELATYRLAEGETVLRDRTFLLPVSGRAQSYLEIIRFAASNRLCVDLKYQGSVRRIEPYSLRRTQDGNVVLHATRASDGGHRSYRIDRIQGARASRQSFIPRFVVELTPQGPTVIPPTVIRTEFPGLPRQRAHTTPRRPRSVVWADDPRYIYECTYCGKRFARKKTTSRLNPHKDKSGYPCPGRTAFLVDTRY